MGELASAARTARDMSHRSGRAALPRSQGGSSIFGEPTTERFGRPAGAEAARTAPCRASSSTLVSRGLRSAKMTWGWRAGTIRIGAPELLAGGPIQCCTDRCAPGRARSRGTWEDPDAPVKPWPSPWWTKAPLAAETAEQD